MSPKPYKISVPQTKLDSLQTKLQLAEFPDELSEANWDLGAPLADVKRLTKAWQSFDWRAAEAELNQLPQFTTGIKVDGFAEMDIHFVHQKSANKGAIPLLFVHGWPGSFIEVIHLLPLLQDPTGPAFHIVAPSLPNYGFSEGPKTRGFAIAQYAETCHKLMLSLGYNEYVSQGGDWGSHITRAMAILYPQHLRASHLNMQRPFAPRATSNPLLALQHSLKPYSAAEKAGFERTEWFAKEGRGYNLLQSTKPQTLSYALQDSPVALLAWIYEKLHDWTDGYQWTDQEILRWISIYQFSRMGPGAAHRIYYEMNHTQPGEGKVTGKQISEWVGGVKLGLAYNPRELGVFPATWCRTLGPVVYESFNDHGGHFMATEHPEWLARDLKVMFGKGGGAYGVIKGKSGYDDKARL